MMDRFWIHSAEKNINNKSPFPRRYTAFWVQFEIGVLLDRSQEHAFLGPDFVINSHMSPMRFLMDVSSKITTFASKKTPKLMLKICKKLFLHYIELSRPWFGFLFIQDTLKTDKKLRRGLQDVSKRLSRWLWRFSARPQNSDFAWDIY